MRWVAFSGSWRHYNSQVERDVREAVREVVNSGNGVVTGGALGVDFFATDELLRIEPTAKALKIFIPTPLGVYAAHYRVRAQEGVITQDQAEELIAQLEKVRALNPKALVGNPNNTVVDRETYFAKCRGDTSCGRTESL